ncbi:MAG: T9SS type A sorting domain-containing protein [Dolichospermum sp.]
MKKSLFLFFALAIFLIEGLVAQTTITTATSTTGYTGGNGVLGNSCITFSVNNTNNFAITIDALETFKSANYPANAANFTLWYSTTSLSGAADLSTSDWVQIVSTQSPQTLSGGYNTVLNNIGFSVPALTEYRFALQSDNGIAYSGSAAGQCTPSTLTANGVELKLGDVGNVGNYIGYGGVFPNPPNNPRWFTGSITFFPTLPCTTPPLAGTAVSTSTVSCVGIPFTLNLTGASTGTGLTYQWDSSSNGTNWFPIAGGDKKVLVKSQITTSQYRCRVTCSGNTVTSNTVTVTSPPLVAGTFTINSGLATGGTNFQTFTEAMNYISCGIGGPVVFSVVPGSGPYTEQVVIPQIGGTSATNTIKINGNGEILTFNSTNTNARAVITLNGIDYLTIDSLVVDATSGTYGWGILLTNKADYNTIKRCTINSNTSSTSSNYVGLVINGAANGLQTSGDNGNYNSITNNTFNGGLYGVYLYGNSSSTTQNNGNLVENNTILDMHSYGIFASYQSSGLIIGKNNISRPARQSSGTTGGVSLAVGCVGALVEKNRIHNLFDAMSTNTSVFYGVNVACDGKATKENVIVNNVIYNINGNGTAYGIYNAGGDSMKAYHNTIILDEVTTTTGNTYGFYQTGAATGIDFRNNIVVLTRAGTGIKRVFQFVTPSSDIKSNNNVFYFSATSGSNNNFGQIGTINYPLFSDWLTANASIYDQQSIEDDPLFVNLLTGDLAPTSANINDIGANLGVITDISGKTRAVLTPDPGAYEYSPAPCTTPPTSGTVVASTLIACANASFSLKLSGNNTGLGQTYSWEKSLNGTSGWTAVTAASTNPAISTSQNVSYYYRCGVKCGSGATVYTPTQLINTPSLVSGTFTINSSVATGGTNFQSFGDAINYISCGINGAVVFNVVPNSGPYNEQVIIPAISGTSATKTVTINGNGETLNFASTSATNRTALTLNGADHIIIDSLIIDVSAGTTAGWGIVLMKQADSNTIKRCTILNNTTSTSTNYINILINGSNSALAGLGNNGSNNNFIGNTLIGGYYGFYLYGNTGSITQNVGNIISKNNIQDFYAYGINLLYQSPGLKISQNNIYRPNRTNSVAASGVYVSTGTIGALIEKNRIHNLYDAFGTGNTTTYGIYVSADAKPGFENKIINNLIYNINNNGPVYGIYNNGGDSMQVYHNTIVLDDGGTTTGAAYGLYQLGAATGIVYKNNLVYVARSGTGIKRCIHFNTTGSSIVSNNNILYLNSTTGTNNNVGQFGTSTYATLNDWKGANSNAYDQQSLDVDPVLTNPTPDDYIPSNGIINGIGTNVGVTTDINGATRGATPDPGAFEINISGCINPPLPGTAVSSAAIICPSTTFTLSLNGNSIGTGQSYQWQVSTNNVTFTNIGLSSNNSSYTASQLATRYYRAAITCSGGTTVYSASVLVTTPSAFSGNYTVNSGVTTGGNNFQTFGEALNTISCAGVGGAITLNVAPGSGPYNERIIIPAINGISSVNKLTINGNGATLVYNTNDIANKAAIILNGADNIVIDSLNIDVSGGNYGWGIVLTGRADSNIIRNCTINTDIVATTTNYGGIFINGSASSVAVSANNGNNNTIINNTINGGYYGVYLYGNTTNSTQNVNNKIVGNKINDVYTNSIYATYQSTGLVISNNNISRELRANSGTCAGIYLTTGCVGTVIEKNRIHSMFEGQLSATATFYGIYVGSKGKPSAPTKVINNLISNISGNGIVYGIYNTSADTMQAYHNTIVFDDVTSASGSVYGLYQTGTATAVDFRNNLVSITRGGSGLKRCAYYITTTSSITSNNNIFYMNAGGGTNNHIGQFGTTNYTTLANWQTANGNAYDPNSISVNPTFTAAGILAGNYIPSAIQCDNVGVNLGVTTDLLESNRTSSPDAGAFEFIGTVLVPVDLANFSGYKNGNVNTLNWTTLTEVNNKGFELQRSANGRDFSTLGYIASKAESGTSSKPLKYVFNDNLPFDGNNYYRLKQIDNDGRSSVSNVVTINNKSDKFQIANLFPNPVINKLNLVVNATKDEKLSIIITDIIGKLLFNEKYDIKKGTNTLNINTEKLVKGIYTVQIVSALNPETVISKFIKQ